MGRGRREKVAKNSSITNLIYISGGIVFVILIVFTITFAVYNKKLKEYSYSSLTTEKIDTGIIYVLMKKKFRKVHHSNVKTKKCNKQTKPKPAACTEGTDQSLNTE